MKSAEHRMNNHIRYRDGNHPAQTQFTPEYVLEPVRVDLGGSIGLDPCTTPENPVGADRFYTVDDDGLSQPWWWAWTTIDGNRLPTEHLPSVFCNPPYGKAREPWVERCIAAGARGQKVILLMPAATDTRIFRLAASSSRAIVYVTGRVKFGTLRPNRRQYAASHPSALIGWNTSLAACSELGWKASPA